MIVDLQVRILNIS